MNEHTPEQAVYNRLIHWAEKEDLIRAMLLYSSRANRHASTDIFSDYDILLAVTDVRRSIRTTVGCRISGKSW
jgi:hypothetical protein